MGYPPMAGTVDTGMGYLDWSAMADCTITSWKG
jgi:hypothetical protein